MGLFFASSLFFIVYECDRLLYHQFSFCFLMNYFINSSTILNFYKIKTRHEGHCHKECVCIGDLLKICSNVEYSLHHRVANNIHFNIKPLFLWEGFFFGGVTMSCCMTLLSPPSLPDI